MRIGRYVSFALKVALIAALLAVVSSGCGNTAKDVVVKRIGPRAIEEAVMVAGNLQAANPTQVIPQVFGSVAQVFVEPGQEVAAGEVLAQLDTSNLEQSLLSAKASLESAQAIATMFNNLSSSAAGFSSSMNSMINAVDASARSLYMLEKGLIGVLPEENRMAALQAVESSYQSYLDTRSQSAPPAAISTGGVSTGAQQAAARKAIENAQKNLDEAIIKAPIAGTVIAVSAGTMSIETMMGALLSSFSGMMPSGLDLSALTGMTGGMETMGMATPGPLAPGSLVVPGSPVYTIVDLDNMTMAAKVDEVDIVKIQPEQPATLSLESYPEKRFEGKVTKVADTATTNEAGATAFEVTITMDRPGPEVALKIGMTGTADVVVASKDSALVIPVEAVVEKKGKRYIFKVVDGKAELTEVKLGIVTDKDVEVIRGAKRGDYVVVKGVEKLKDGQGVKI